MLALTLSNRGYMLIQLLLLLPELFISDAFLLEPGLTQISYLNDFVQNVIKEKPADTLLLIKRGQDVNCVLKDFNSHHFIPTLRHDESTIISVRDHFNSEAIALVCMSELADSMLLTSLAKDLHRMRETRIIIWLQTLQSTLIAFLDIITDQASNHSFLSLIVLHSTLSEVNGSVVAYRLHPFPNPKIVRILDLYNGTIYPKFWTNFRNKTAVAIPSLYPPSSFVFRDKKSGKLMLSGIMDKLIIEFAKRSNIHLRLHRPLDKVESIDDKAIVQLTNSGEVDLSMYRRFCTVDVECTSVVAFSKIFIVVPCGENWGIGDVYSGFRTLFLVVLGAYILFAIMETVFAAVTCRIYGNRFRFSYSSLLVNLSAYRGVLGMYIDLNRNRRGISLHHVLLIMSLFSLIFNCFFNANLSTLLTKRPQNNQISNFEELKQSGLPIISEKMFRHLVEIKILNDRAEISREQIVFVSSAERMKMIVARNTSSAYLMVSKMWYALNKYQTHHHDNVFCDSSGLVIFGFCPLHGILKPNSIYFRALHDFIYASFAIGLNKHWTLEAYEKVVPITNHSSLYPHPTPLSFNDLHWLWRLIGQCYIICILIFMGEILKDYWQRRRVSRLIELV